VITRKKILLVEDNSDFGGLLALLLNRFGYDAIQVGSGIAAINHASEKHPDLILMDIRLA
jgi:DNA-binding response OmpR family regulator